jgi:hypothetical protein
MSVGIALRGEISPWNPHFVGITPQGTEKDTNGPCLGEMHLFLGLTAESAPS